MKSYVLCLTLLLAACNSNPPTPLPPPAGQWQTYGGIEPKVTNGHFDFPITSDTVAGYFYTKIPAKAGQILTLTYDITGTNPVWAQHVQSDGSSDTNPASMTLFLWRNGDDLGGGGTGKASYRFWCPIRIPLMLGPGTLGCRLDGNVWTNVAGKVDPNGFQAALNDALGLGFTFGGAQFYGHGVYLSSGTATFKINSFSAQ